jgi:NAD-dependent SIR2 family protein deacetylase
MYDHCFTGIREIEMPDALATVLRRAAEAINGAEAMLIGAGAGMGVDSGLPDFRGSEGFWRAYPPYRKLGLDFKALADPRWFREDPPVAWGFYGHRLELYRRTEPHEGFEVLRKWGERMPLGAFVYTSNVDGQFQRAGFDHGRIIEVHGAIDRLQCIVECGVGVFSAHSTVVTIDEKTMRARRPLPQCPQCGVVARPSILMFGDREWDDTITRAQRRLLHSWLKTLHGRRIVVVECGAGTAIPTVRNACEELSRKSEGTLIRINTRDLEAPHGQINLPLGARDGLLEIQRILQGENS